MVKKKTFLFMRRARLGLNKGGGEGRRCDWAVLTICLARSPPADANIARSPPADADLMVNDILLEFPDKTSPEKIADFLSRSQRVQHWFSSGPSIL